LKSKYWIPIKSALPSIINKLIRLNDLSNVTSDVNNGLSSSVLIFWDSGSDELFVLVVVVDWVLSCLNLLSGLSLFDSSESLFVLLSFVLLSWLTLFVLWLLLSLVIGFNLSSISFALLSKFPITI